MPHRHLNFEPPVIAHRGSRVRAPENTMAAFEAAREDGATWIETDVKLTSDGVAVLIHDDNLDRTTNGRGAVAETSWAQMKAFDAGSWFSPVFTGTRIPMLADLLTFARATGMRLNLELKPCKGRARATAMVALIETAKMWPETALPPLISSFDIEALMIAAQLHPGWPRGLLLDRWQDDWRELATQTQASAVHFNERILTPDRLTVLREAHVPVLAYTVNDERRAKELIDAGVRAVFSDKPADIIRAF